MSSGHFNATFKSFKQQRKVVHPKKYGETTYYALPNSVAPHTYCLSGGLRFPATSTTFESGGSLRSFIVEDVRSDKGTVGAMASSYAATCDKLKLLYDITAKVMDPYHDLDRQQFKVSVKVGADGEPAGADKRMTCVDKDDNFIKPEAIAQGDPIELYLAVPAFLTYEREGQTHMKLVIRLQNARSMVPVAEAAEDSDEEEEEEEEVEVEVEPTPKKGKRAGASVPGAPSKKSKKEE